jgi:hypothetical protein
MRRVSFNWRKPNVWRHCTTIFLPQRQPRWRYPQTSDGLRSRKSCEYHRSTLLAFSVQNAREACEEENPLVKDSLQVGKGTVVGSVALYCVVLLPIQDRIK